MIVDPFFIIWNPYDVEITAQKFAITLQTGLPGGIKFRVTHPDGSQTIHGKDGVSRGKPVPSTAGTTFSDYAARAKGNPNMSYLASNITMEPGEVLIYAPPKETDRGSDANVVNDEMVPTLNFSADITDNQRTGISFDQFPDHSGNNWAPIKVADGENPEDYQVEVMFVIGTQDKFAISSISETNLPGSDQKPNDLDTEANFGDHLAGKEYRLNVGQREESKEYNYNNGRGGFPNDLKYKFSDFLIGQKESFGICSMLTLPTDHVKHNAKSLRMEVFSQLNVTPITCTNTEYSYRKGPPNIVSNVFSKRGINNLLQEIEFDISLDDWVTYHSFEQENTTFVPAKKGNLFVKINANYRSYNY